MKEKLQSYIEYLCKRKLDDGVLDEMVKELLPYKDNLEIHSIITDILAYRDTKNRILLKDARVRIAKLLKRRNIWGNQVKSK